MIDLYFKIDSFTDYDNREMECESFSHTMQVCGKNAKTVIVDEVTINADFLGASISPEFGKNNELMLEVVFKNGTSINRFFTTNNRIKLDRQDDFFIIKFY